jgi:hypothetical protein
VTDTTRTPEQPTQPDAPSEGLDAVEDRRWWTWPVIVLGAAICAWAVFGAISDDEIASPLRWAGWLVIPAIIHDTIWAAAVGVGAVASIWLPRWAKIPFRVGLGMTAVVLLIAWPLLGRYGERPDNPTVLPFDYWPRVLVLLAAIWGSMAIWAIVRIETSRRTR